METKKTIAIINDPQVTLGSIQPNDIDQIFAWEIDWKSLSPKDNYIILGGHMGAYDTEEFPYLTSEKKWLRKVIPLGTKILGICLGAQLIADAMGGKAYLSDEIEFGFKKLEFHNNYDFLSKFENLGVFVWHRDTFTLPPDAELIATSKFPQIFKLFNTFAEEDKDQFPDYGLVKDLETFNPIKIAFHEYWNILKDMLRKDISIKQKFFYLFAPPGWSLSLIHI